MSEQATIRKPADGEVYLNKPQVRTRYGNISDTGFTRWRNDPLVGFPPPDIYIKGREFWRVATLCRFDEERSVAPELAH
jgi:hypothetical protein